MVGSDHSQETERLLLAFEDGNESALDSLLAMHRDYLRRLVVHRMDPLLRSRVDPSDIMQEVLMQVSKRIDDFVTERPLSFRLWLRRKAMDGLADQERRHLKAQKRSIRREHRLSDVSSIAIAQKLMLAGPHQVDRQQDLSDRVKDALAHLSDMDREMLLLRYAEELSNAEVAELLQIGPETARKRHGRAIQRLYQQLLDTDPSGLPPQT